MLEFEHLIQINDPQQPQIPVMSRAHLWAGLVQRAKYPDQFNNAITSRLEVISENEFIRHLQVGDQEIPDSVVLMPPDEILTRLHTSNPPLHAESITRIEEPEPGFLFVRFIYRRDSATVPGGLDVDEYLKSAYLLNDRDGIAQIRQAQYH